MNAGELMKMSTAELQRIKRKNQFLFHSSNIINLVVFYHSLFKENWALLFLTFGIFIAGLSLYDNYRLTADIMEGQKS